MAWKARGQGSISSNFAKYVEIVNDKTMENKDENDQLYFSIISMINPNSRSIDMKSLLRI